MISQKKNWLFLALLLGTVSVSQTLARPNDNDYGDEEEDQDHSDDYDRPRRGRGRGRGDDDNDKDDRRGGRRRGGRHGGWDKDMPKMSPQDIVTNVKKLNPPLSAAVNPMLDKVAAGTELSDDEKKQLGDEIKNYMMPRRALMQLKHMVMPHKKMGKKKVMEERQEMGAKEEKKSDTQVPVADASKPAPTI